MEKKKELLLKALKNSKAVITTACEAAQVSRQTFYDWKENDPDFAKAYEEILEDGLDYAEGVVFECMKMAEPIQLFNDDGTEKKDTYGNLRIKTPDFKEMRVALDAAEFYLERKGKDRGYSIRTELEDVTKRERLRVADLFPSEEELDQISEDEAKKREEEKDKRKQ